MEVCCYHMDSALIAEKYGADRVELCDNSHEGGTTPSYGFIKYALKKLSIPVFIMIRPRGGDFLYTPEEIEIMLTDIQKAKSMGAQGVVFGVLTTNGALDLDLMKLLIQTARPMQVTLHRAFDMTSNPFVALQQAGDLGVDRILTSGQMVSADLGIPVLAKLIEQSPPSLQVMPGGGIRTHNLISILEQTGAREFHVSALGTRESYMHYQPAGISMGSPHASEYQLSIADGNKVQTFRKLANEFSGLYLK